MVASTFAVTCLLGCGSAPPPETVDYPLGPVVHGAETASPRLTPPQVGDEVLFAQAGDNGHLVGRVSEVEPDGTVRFTYERNGRQWQGVLNLRQPGIRRDPNGRILNSYIRTKRKDDPENARYLAGELLVGFRAPP